MPNGWMDATATAATTTNKSFVRQITYAIALTMMIAKSKENTKVNKGETRDRWIDPMLTTPVVASI